MLLFLWSFSASAQHYSISGTVRTANTREPIPDAIIYLQETGLWAVADNKGYFEIQKIQAGTYTIKVSCLGFVPYENKMNINKDFSSLFFDLKSQNLSIDEVTVTANASSGDMNTVKNIDRTALDHLQMINISDITSLLPGGVTRNPNLMNDNRLALREGHAGAALSSFGTAVEVDGVRLSANPIFGDPLNPNQQNAQGPSTRNIATTNVEAIEVITGIPSVEHGDITNGVVRIKTRQGRTPYTFSMLTNPYNKQFAVAKGFAVGRSFLNTGFEYTRALSNTASPYDTYKRISLTLNYSTTFRRSSASPIRFEAGLSGNTGGLNNEEDPDAYSDYYAKKRDYAIRFSTNGNWLLNKSWLTSLEWKGALIYEDNRYEVNNPVTTSTEGVAVNSPVEGYYVANALPMEYQALSYNDSKPFEYNAEVKGNWARSFGETMHKLKVGVAWKGSGNLGEGTYYKDPSLQANAYRPRSYKDIPFMNNLAVYLEEKLTFPLGTGSLAVLAGIRAEQTFIEASRYNNIRSFSPRFNVKYTLVDKKRTNGLKHLSIRAGWGIMEKLPSFNILYPEPRYADKQVFAQSYDNGKNIYVYHTLPYQLAYKDDLKWMRNNSVEVGLDMNIRNIKIVVAGFYNKIKDAYYINETFTPYQYRVSQIPDGYTMPVNPNVYVDSKTGEIYISDKDHPDAGPSLMDTRFIDQTFIRNLSPENNAPVHHAGVEWTVDFPEIKPINTSFRLDGKYSYSEFIRTGLSSYLSTSGHTEGGGRSFQYVAIFPNTINSSTTYNGMWEDEWRLNFTTITRIPKIRMIATLRVEGMLYSRSQNKSSVNGKTLAYAIDDNRNPTGQDIYAGDVASALWPYYYMNTEGQIFPFTEESAKDPVLQRLIRYTTNTFAYNEGGYNAYFLANFSLTKEIGDLASISFYANNCTNMRKTMEDRGNRVKVILGGNLYYGLSLRLKF